jgi:hypothetical protein
MYLSAVETNLYIMERYIYYLMPINYSMAVSNRILHTAKSKQGWTVPPTTILPFLLCFCPFEGEL